MHMSRDKAHVLVPEESEHLNTFLRHDFEHALVQHCISFTWIDVSTKLTQLVEDLSTESCCGSTHQQASRPAAGRKTIILEH